jgi:5-dehydro-2-deoxygluconokinase
VKGFAVGRSIFAEAAVEWMRDTISDEAAVKMMAQKFGALVEAWRKR